ncbi:hypothetical protein [Helicobacter himalayensis]|uniref:hypothetical protein n=1 Tax=Helicobacter himalayensis TaxID=1591088 RepID=UPI0012E7AD83|nr:hypothetical protein [Helicobacter himalayensis]
MRPRNVEILQNADLIVFEKSLNDIGAFANELECASLKVLKRNARWCFETLHKLKRKVCVLLLPRYDCKQLYTEPINDFYRALCVEFGFNFVDVARFYEEHNLEDYAKSADSVHPPLVIMRILGRKIAKYIEDFSLSCTMPKYTGAKFKILTAKEMQGCAKESHLKFMQNSRYSEETYMLYAGDSLAFPPQCNGAKIIGIHTWSRGLKDFNFRFFGAPMLIENKKASMVYETSAINCVFSVKDSFYVSTPTTVRLGEEIPINMLNNALMPPPPNSKISIQKHWSPFINNPAYRRLDCVGVVGFLLVINEGIVVDFETRNLSNQNLNGDLTALLCPMIDEYLEFLEEYEKLEMNKKIYAKAWHYTCLLPRKIMKRCQIKLQKLFTKQPQIHEETLI